MCQWLHLKLFWPIRCWGGVWLSGTSHSWRSKKLVCLSQHYQLPESLRGNNTNQNKNRHPSVHHNFNGNVNSSKESQSPIVNSSIVTQPQIVNSSVNNQALDETEIVHLGKSSKDDCSLFIQTRKKTHKALWDSGACKCVLSLGRSLNINNQSLMVLHCKWI